MTRRRRHSFAMSRRKRNGLFALCVLVMITVVWLDKFHGDEWQCICREAGRDTGILRTFGPACPGANGNLPRIGGIGFPLREAVGRAERQEHQNDGKRANR